MPLHMTMTMVRQCQDERGRDKNGTRKARRLTGREASDLLPYTGRKGDIREERITRREIKRTKKMESVGNAWKYQSLSNMPLERKNFHSDLNDFWYGGRIGRYSVAHFQEDNILHIFKMNILELILGSILSVRFFSSFFFRIVHAAIAQVRLMPKLIQFGFTLPILEKTKVNAQNFLKHEWLYNNTSRVCLLLLFLERLCYRFAGRRA